jgi:misacylated tRNA(Ala) deacylase
MIRIWKKPRIWLLKNGKEKNELVLLKEPLDMTELLHMHDNYIHEFDAKITNIGENYVILDRTAFYPLGGGQSSDKGILSQGEISLNVDIVKKEEGEIRHFIDGDIPFVKSQKVHGELDWNWRYECMRFHTAQHLLSRHLQLEYGLETIGNMIKPGKSRADYQPLEEFPEDIKRAVEAGVNEVISRNIDVDIQFMPRKEAIEFLHERGYSTRYLDMVPSSVTEFRVLIIGDYDASSCAGTHVRNTREIGSIHLGKSKNVGASKRRIYFSLASPSSSTH